jgi:uncharacterized protein (DUF488 family)
MSKMKIFTLGHSNRLLEEFMKLLEIERIDILVDVRRFPHSRRHPQFNRENLRETLLTNDMDYQWMGESLGGFRDGGYEEYMKSDAFKQGIDEIIELASDNVIALMCAEKDWTRCHREHISNHLAERGHEVIHILDETEKYTHPSLV